MAKEINMQTNEAELKAVAKAVGSSLKRAGHAVPHSTVLHALAAALNKRDWNTLKASLEPATTVAAIPAIAPAKPTFEDRTWFFLRLAMAMGNPVTPVPTDNSLALARAVEAVGKSVDGVLKWGGWNLPATLTFQTSHIDAGDFKPEKKATSGRMTVTLKGGILVDFELGYTAAAGWYVSSRGSQEFYEQLEEAISEAQVVAQSCEVAVTPPSNGDVVKAKFWTDDRVFEVDFDARPYLLNAPDTALTAIMEVGFVGDQSTDWVAEYVAEKGLNEDLSEAFTYLGAVRKAKRRDPLGFECEVDRDGYLQWMAANRQQLLADLLCSRANVAVRESKETEASDAGWRWEVLENGKMLQHSSLHFECEAAARLDAYHELDLLNDALQGLL